MLAPVAVFHRFLFFGIPMEVIGGDSLRVWSGNGTPVFDFLRSLAAGHGLPAWSESFSRPHFNLTSELAPLFETLIQFFTRDIAATVKADTFLHLITGGLGAYFLSRRLFRDGAAAFLTGLLYIFLPFNISTLQAEMGRAWGPMLAPFAYLALVNVIWRPSLISVWSCAFVLGLATLCHPEYVFLTGFFMVFAAALIFIFRPPLNYGTSQVPRPTQALPALFAVLVLFIGLWGFHLIFSVLHDNPYTVVESVENWLRLKAPPSQEAVRQSQPLWTAITLQHWEWRATPMTWGIAPPLEPLWILPGLSFLGAVILAPKNRWVWIWTALALFSLWFSLGMRVRPSLFEFCHDHVPLFSLARHPNRFLLHYCLAAALFSGLLLSRLLTAALRGRGLWVRPAGCLALVPFICAGYLQGTHYNFTFLPVEQPAYVDAIRGWLDARDTENHRVIDGSGMPRLSTVSFRSHVLADELLLRYHARPFSADLLALLGFKYVALGDRPQEYEKMFGKKGFMPDRADDAQDRADVLEYFSNLLERKGVAERLLAQPDWVAHRAAGAPDVVIFENRKAFSGYELYPAYGVLTVGGPHAYFALAYPELKSRGQVRPVPVFLAQRANAARAGILGATSSFLLLHNTGPMDLWVSRDREKIRFLEAYGARAPGWQLGFQMTGLAQFNPALPALDHGYLNQLFGNLVFSRFLMITQGAAEPLRFTFEVPAPAPHEPRLMLYQIFVRALHAPEAGPVEIFLDGRSLGRQELNQRSGLWWIPVRDLTLGTGGKHTLEIRPLAQGFVGIDGVLIEPLEVVAEGLLNARKDFSNLSDLYLVTRDRVLNAPEGGKTWVDLRKPGTYEVHLDADGPVEVEVDGAPVSPGAAIELEEGSHAILLRGAVDTFRSLLVKDTAREARIPAVKEFSYQRVGADRMDFQGESDSPYFMMQPETYFPGWQADWNGRATPPLISHLFLNAYPVSESGRVQGRIIYRNPVLTALGWLSALIFLIPIALLVFKSRPRVRQQT
ncbi:MAG: hypothetical protein HYY14_05665 [Candidatus Omnitrophica bacterium]|nr:hypothetical protein [Candidatus Omnitrophota bacterium]